MKKKKGSRVKKAAPKRKMGKKKSTVNEDKTSAIVREQASPEKKSVNEKGDTFTSQQSKIDREKEQAGKPELPHPPQTMPLEEHHEVVKS